MRADFDVADAPHLNPHPGADSAGPKNVAVFLHSLATRAPLMLIANLELLQPHLNTESYALRCGAVSAHGQLLIQLGTLQAGGPSRALAESCRRAC